MKMNYTFCITAVLFFGWLDICLSFWFDQVHIEFPSRLSEAFSANILSSLRGWSMRFDLSTVRWRHFISGILDPVKRDVLPSWFFWHKKLIRDFNAIQSLCTSSYYYFHKKVMFGPWSQTCFSSFSHRLKTVLFEVQQQTLHWKYVSTFGP